MSSTVSTSILEDVRGIHDDITELTSGFPSKLSLLETGQFMAEASRELQKTFTIDQTHILAYGPVAGGVNFRTEVAKFLTEAYGDPVDSESLFCTSGATRGLLLACSMFFDTGAPLFIEDPTYFIALQMLKDELNMNLIPVPMTHEGLDPEELDRAATKLAKEVPFTPTPQRPYRALVYTVPAWHNPMGITYTEERSKELIKVARKHDLCLFCDDVYNLLHFGSGAAEPRIFSFDKKTDPDYKGSVISNGSFSKYMAPGLRVGWLECPLSIIDVLKKSKQVWSGGCLNQYMSEVMAIALRKGLVKRHVDMERNKIKVQLEGVCEVLEKHLPKEVKYHRPNGGYFMWLVLPEGADCSEVVKHCRENYKVSFLAGHLTSPSGLHKNCIRMSYSYVPVEPLKEAVRKMCLSISHHLESLK